MNSLASDTHAPPKSNGNATAVYRRSRVAVRLHPCAEDRDIRDVSLSEGEVIKVADGDTLDIVFQDRNTDTYRRLGVDTPKPHMSKPELPISSCLDPSNAPSSTRAIVVSLTDAVNHPIKLTKPSLGVVS